MKTVSDTDLLNVQGGAIAPSLSLMVLVGTSAGTAMAGSLAAGLLMTTYNWANNHPSHEGMIYSLSGGFIVGAIAPTILLHAMHS